VNFFPHMATKYHKIATIKHKGQQAKFKIVSDSKGPDIREAIRSRFQLGSESQFILIDERDGTDVVADGTLETGNYDLVLPDEAGSCCPPGSLPATLPPADYKTQGKEENLDGTKVYVVKPDRKTGKAVIFFPDVFGWNGGRIRQLADEFALAGFLSIIPDVFGDDNWRTDRDSATLPTWVKQFPWDPLVSKHLAHMYAYLEQQGVSKIGVVGFCWGSYPVLKASATGKVQAGVSFHPSHPRISAAMGEDEKALLEAVKVPQLFLPAGNDGETVKEKGLADGIFKKSGVELVIKEFPESAHGWSIRGDLSSPTVARDVRQAVDLAKQFFQKHL